MDKASGVYYYISDNSIRPSGASAFGGIVPMFTKKGPIGKLITVTAKDYQDILGYDLQYNQAYLGLGYMLESVAKLEVLRLNQGAAIANRSWKMVSQALTSSSVVGVISVDELDGLMWVAHKTPGDWGSYGVQFVDNGDGTYTLNYGKKTASSPSPVHKLVQSKVFSFDPEASNYWKKVSLSDVAFWFAQDSFPTGFTPDAATALEGGNWHSLDNGTDGTVAVGGLTADVLTSLASALDKSASNVIVGNGFSSVQGVCNALVQAGEKRLMSVFIDVPDLTGDPDTMSYTENDDSLRKELCIGWAETVYRSEYCQLVSVPDIVATAEGDVFVWPSVNLFKIYAKMYSDYGNVRYPPAGYTYGNISVSKLMESDFHLWKDELKTNRINYQVVGSRGPVMWEQRTTYALDSDLSYASTVFILRDLRARLIDFMTNFNFRYATPMDLLNIKSGLDTILSDFKRNYFLVNYVLDVPTFEEAQAAGRTLDIPISVSVINDMEVINLNVTLENAANLRAA